MDKYRCNWWGLQIFLSVYGSEQLHTKLLENKHKLDGQSLKEKYFCWPAWLTEPMQLLDWQNYYSNNWLIQSRLKKKVISIVFCSKLDQTDLDLAKRPGDIIQYKTSWRFYFHAFNLFGLFCRSMKDLPWHKRNWFLFRPVCHTPVTGLIMQGCTIQWKIVTKRQTLGGVGWVGVSGLLIEVGPYLRPCQLIRIQSVW